MNDRFRSSTEERTLEPGHGGPSAGSDLPATGEQTAGQSLYRLEALRAHREGDPAAQGSEWLEQYRSGRDLSRFGFYGLLLLALAAVVSATTLPVEDRVVGTAVVRAVPSAVSSGAGLKIEVRVPEARRSQLTVGQTLRLELDAHPSARIEGRITRIARRDLKEGEESASTGEGLLGRKVALEVWIELLESAGSDPSVELHAGLRGRADILVTSAPLAAHLLPGFGSTPEDES